MKRRGQVLEEISPTRINANRISENKKKNMKKIPIAFVGLRFGKVMLDGLTRDPDWPFRLTAVCDTDDEKREACAAAYGVPGYSELEPILADPHIPALALITPPHGRSALIRTCLEAGKHVMTTKPFELDPTAAESVLELAEAKGVALHLNSPMPRTQPWVAQVHAWRDDHRLGRPSLAIWQRHVSRNEDADGGWYDDPERCPLAPMFRLGVYAMNDLLEVLDDDPVAVTVMGSRVRTGRPTPDVAGMQIRFASGCIASLCVTFCSEVGWAERSMSIHYERGSVYRDLMPDADFPAGWKLKLVRGGMDTPVTTDETVAPQSGYDWEFFAEWVRGGRPKGDLTRDRLLQCVRLAAAMKRAEASGREERL